MELIAVYSHGMFFSLSQSFFISPWYNVNFYSHKCLRKKYIYQQKRYKPQPTNQKDFKNHPFKPRGARCFFVVARQVNRCVPVRAGEPSDHGSAWSGYSVLNNVILIGGNTTRTYYIPFLWHQVHSAISSCGVPPTAETKQQKVSTRVPSPELWHWLDNTGKK